MKGKILIVFVSMLLLSSALNTRLVITVSEKSGGLLDLYTSENRFCGQNTTFVGKGANEPCDALTDDVNVTLFVEVTCDGEPVMHVLVAFEVWWNISINWQTMVQTPMNQCVLYRTVETDKDGIAQIWFRVPTPCTGRMHGKWVAIATAKVQEQKIEDTMPFDVGFLITLVKVDLLNPPPDGYMRDNPPSHGPDCISYNVTLKNIAWTDKHLMLIAVAYDDCDVPISQVIIDIVILGGVYCSPHNTSIVVTCNTVPQWAYVGMGKLYVSAFTALPRDCGVAYCPEVSATFLIKYVP